MHGRDPGLCRTTAEHLLHTGIGEAALAPEPQPALVGQRVTGPDSQILVERLRRLRTERAGPRAASLPHDEDDAGVEIDVVSPQTGQLGQPDARVEEQRMIAASRRSS